MPLTTRHVHALSPSRPRCYIPNPPFDPDNKSHGVSRHGVSFSDCFLYTHLYTHPPALRTDIDTHHHRRSNTHPPTSTSMILTIDTSTTNHPPENRHRFLFSSPRHPTTLFCILRPVLLFFPTSALALHWRRPDRDLVENLVHFLSLVFRLVFEFLVSAVGGWLRGCNDYWKCDD